MSRDEQIRRLEEANNIVFTVEQALYEEGFKKDTMKLLNVRKQIIKIANELKAKNPFENDSGN